MSTFFHVKKVSILGVRVGRNHIWILFHQCKFSSVNARVTNDNPRTSDRSLLIYSPKNKKSRLIWYIRRPRRRISHEKLHHYGADEHHDPDQCLHRQPGRSEKRSQASNSLSGTELSSIRQLRRSRRSFDVRIQKRCCHHPLQGLMILHLFQLVNKKEASSCYSGSLLQRLLQFLSLTP